MEFLNGNENLFFDWFSKQKDAYSQECFRYAMRWADLMEEHIEKNGILTKDIADSTSSTSDTTGITGFMFGASKSILYQTWKYGGMLKELYIKK